MSNNSIHNLVTLSGGGARAVISNQALVYIERYCNAPVSRLFQGVYGTSTGAIQAVALTAPNALTAVGLEKAYETLLQKVFQKRFWGMGGWAGPKYDAEPLENQLRTVLGSHTLREATIPTGTVTYNIRSREPELWASYGYQASQLAWKAARASSAAPTYFEPFGDYIDGGIVANMPSAWAAIDYSRFMGVPLSRIRVLNIGTGTAEAPIQGAKSRGVLGWVSDIVDIGMAGGQDLEEIFCKSLGLAGYLELQVNLPKSAEAMDNVSAVAVLQLKQLGNQMVGQKLRELHAFLDSIRGETLPKAA